MKRNLQWHFESGAFARYRHNFIAAAEDSLQFLFINAEVNEVALRNETRQMI
jgi:hypothetical protein